jgi:hypothetical protein
VIEKWRVGYLMQSKYFVLRNKTKPAKTSQNQRKPDIFQMHWFYFDAELDLKNV